MALPKTFQYRTGSVAVTLAAMGTFGLAVVCATVFAHPVLQARCRLRELSYLQLDKSTFADAQAFAQKRGAMPTPFSPCSPAMCEWLARTDNSILPAWWRGQGVSFVVILEVKNSLVVRKSIGYGLGYAEGFSPSSVALTEQKNWGRIPRRVPVAADWQTTDRYRYYSFHVYMTPAASAADKLKYTNYNFRCFWKYKGCKDARELLPAAASTPLAQDH